tara:strand:- start:15 stop:935 length:921 start_codon:yes stop_codon:yes gene_type:complete
MKVGSVCSGIGGLELGLSMITETDLRWVSETDATASKVLEKRFNAPNLGDLTQIQDPPKVDLVVGGFPCQPVSVANSNPDGRKGIHDERWLIADVCRLAEQAGARWLLLENVRGLLTANNGDALARVCAEMANRGFVRWEWRTLYASEVGAPHRRDRWFCIATNTKSSSRRFKKSEDLGEAIRQAAEFGKCPSEIASIANAHGEGLQRQGKGHELESCTQEAEATWGRYEGAIRRWESIMGRPAPVPAIDWKMNPEFIEWMMGFPKGWLTLNDFDISYSGALKCLGNAVVPLQAAYAYADLFGRIK